MSRSVVIILIPVLLTCPVICHTTNAQELAASSASHRGQAVVRTVHLCSCCQGERSTLPSNSGSSESGQRSGGDCLCKGGILSANFKDVELILGATAPWVGLLETPQLAGQSSRPCDFVGESSHLFASGRKLRLCLQSLLF